MKRFVVAVLAMALLIGVWLAGSWYLGGGPIGDRTPSPQALAEQAAAITAHRQAQATPPPSAAPTTAALAAPARPYWTGFRGPLRDGHYRERPIQTTWAAAAPRPIWKQPSGRGHASFAIVSGRAFTIEQRGGNEVAAAYDVPTGRELWATSWPATFAETYGGVGPRATPTWSDGVLYALGATGELRALDARTGAVRWRTNILDDAAATNLEWGMAASPLVVGDVVIVVPGGPGGRSIVAYDRRTGTRRWSALDDAAAYASPMLATIGGIEQIVVFTATRLVGLSTDGAQLLWEYPWRTQSGINVAQPLVLDGDRIFISSGYGMGAAMLQMSRDGQAFAVSELWRSSRMKNQFTSSVHQEGFIYGLDESILACLDAATGAVMWKAGRYGHGQTMLASGHLVVVTEEGELVLVRATPERHDEVAHIPLFTSQTWNHPAMSDGYLLLRNGEEMAAFDLRAR